MSEHTMEIEETLEFKNTLTASIPKTEVKKIVHMKEIASIDKSIPCVCGETQYLKTVECTDGKVRNLCRACRQPVTIDITAKSLISHTHDERIVLSPLKVLDVTDLLFEIIGDHKIVRMSSRSTSLQNKVTKSKTVDLYKKYGLKLSRAEPTLTITGRMW